MVGFSGMMWKGRLGLYKDGLFYVFIEFILIESKILPINWGATLFALWILLLGFMLWDMIKIAHHTRTAVSRRGKKWKKWG